jgi:hypothetical protein
MKRVLGLVAIAALVVFGFQLLQEATEYHGGVGAHGAETTVTFHVATKNYHHPDDAAASALWAVCVGSVGWSSASPPVALGDGRYAATVRPSLADDTKRRLSGCINESTLDRVQGHVQSTQDGP